MCGNIPSLISCGDVVANIRRGAVGVLLKIYNPIGIQKFLRILYMIGTDKWTRIFARATSRV